LTAFSAFRIFMFFARCIITSFFPFFSPLEMPRFLFAWSTSTYLAQYL
jgi:hypothetical protein